MKRLLLAFSLFLASAPALLAQATFHGNAARTGVYDSAGPRQLDSLKWKFKTGGPIVGSPAVADGVVYIGSADGFLYAVDQATGKEKWKFETPRQVVSTPTIANGVVYLVGYDATLTALDAATGKPKWRFTSQFERRFQANRLHGYPPGFQTIPDSWDLYLSSPAVVDGRVYYGTGDGGVYAIDASNGLMIWKFSTGDVVHASPAVVNGVVYIGSWDGKFYALDADSGQQKWSFQAGEDTFIHNQQGFQSSAAVVDGVVYTGCRDGHVYALDAATGHKKWEYMTNLSWVNATPAVRDGLVYTATSDSGRFFALDAKTGRLRFNFDAKGQVFSSPALAGGLVYFGSATGRLYALDATSGALLSDFRTEASKNDPMKILNSEGGLNPAAAYGPYFHDYQDMVLSVYRVFSVGAVWSSPVVDHGVLYFGSSDGNLYAIG
ncbi:MAG TPA: PQQ-binding-like beta-propeller repeat protein [Candidatus Acidoferrales bacterium]|nr:PQQ-binding-like beta-propeller repeat protein [Candidatus Acidoferrales bacterium]